MSLPLNRLIHHQVLQIIQFINNHPPNLQFQPRSRENIRSIKKIILEWEYQMIWDMNIRTIQSRNSPCNIIIHSIYTTLYPINNYFQNLNDNNSFHIFFLFFFLFSFPIQQRTFTFTFTLHQSNNQLHLPLLIIIKNHQSHTITTN